MVGYVILLATSIPSALSHVAGIGGFAVAVILVGSGQAGLSAVMYPLIGKLICVSSSRAARSDLDAGDQVPETAPKVKRKTDGQLVVTDRKLTIQFLFNGYYW